MADNVTFQKSALATPASGEVVAADDVGGAKYQRVKLVLGDDGSVDGDAKSVDTKLRVSAMPYLYDIAEGHVADHVSLIKRGANEDVGTTEEVVGMQGGVLTYLTSAEQLKVKSSDGNDTGVALSTGTATAGSATTIEDDAATFSTDTVAVGDIVLNDTDGSYGIITAVDSETKLTVYDFFSGTGNAVELNDAYRIVNANGTGAAVVEVAGVDANYDALHEFVILNGANVITTTASFLRAHTMFIRCAGSTGKNVGNIDANDNANAVTLCRIGIGHNQSLSGYWTVPNGKTFYLVQGAASDASNKGTTIRMYARKYLEPFMLSYVLKLYGSSQIIPYPIPMKLPAKTDIEVRAISIQAGGNVAVTFNGWYE